MSKNELFKRVIEDIKLETKFKQAEIAEKLGVKSTYLSDMINGRVPLTESVENKIYELFHIQIKKESHTANLTIAEKKRIPFYDDVTTIGGTNRLIADTSIQGNISEWIDAGDWFPEATAAIRHYGESMIEYPSGSILALKRVEDRRLLIWGRNYSIETAEFRITKRLQDGGEDYLLAYSSNMSTYPDGLLIHSPIRIPKEAIRYIDLILGCVTKEYSNGAIQIKKQ